MSDFERRAIHSLTGDVNAWQERALAAEARVAELEAENNRLRLQAVQSANDLDVMRTIAKESGTHRARVTELEAAAKDIWPLVNEVRAVVADHYPDGSKHDDQEYERRRSVTAALVRQALTLRDAIDGSTPSVGAPQPSAAALAGVLDAAQAVVDNADPVCGLDDRVQAALIRKLRAALAAVETGSNERG